MSYTSFAHIYDTLMTEDISYTAIADRVEELFSEYGVHPEIVCDLAAGTGNVTLELAKRGYDMIAVDKSPEMLASAREKAAAQSADILFVNQPLEELDLFGSADAFLCMIDGFNYILQPNTLLHIFKRIHDCFISDGGVFIFDMSSFYKLSTVLGDNTFVYDRGDVFYVWKNKFHKRAELAFLDLTFFEKHGKVYRRFSESQVQKAYTEEQIRQELARAGFCDIRTFDGFTGDKPQEKSERILYACRKDK